MKTHKNVKNTKNICKAESNTRRWHGTLLTQGIFFKGHSELLMERGEYKSLHHVLHLTVHVAVLCVSKMHLLPK